MVSSQGLMDYYGITRYFFGNSPFSYLTASLKSPSSVHIELYTVMVDGLTCLYRIPIFGYFSIVYLTSTKTSWAA